MEYMRSQFATAQEILHETYGNSSMDPYLGEYSAGVAENIQILDQHLSNANAR